MIVDTTVKQYRNGGCFALAEALHNITGYPKGCIDFGGFVHAFVVSPDDEVLDIHGKMAWPDFLAFLVKEKVLPEHAVREGRIQLEGMPDEATMRVWVHYGYKPPSKTAIRNATRVAKQHPNLAEIIAPFMGK